MKVKVVGSGSKGNCYIIQEGNQKLILELGLSLKNIKEALNYNLEDVVGCLCSHKHQDHSKSVLKALENSLDVYTCEDVINSLGADKCHRMHCIKPLEQFKVGAFTIMGLPAQHDVECLAFLISAGKDKILFATDTYYLKYKVPGVTKLMIECNYSDDIMEYLPKWENRLLKSHMSLNTCKRTIASFDLQRCNCIMLIHISARHGSKQHFKDEIYKLTGIDTYIAEPGLEVE